MRLKIDWASLLLGRKLTVFLYFTLYLTEIPKDKPPLGAYIWRGDLTEGFCVTSLGGLYLEGFIHIRAYFRNFHGKLSPSPLPPPPPPPPLGA